MKLSLLAALTLCASTLVRADTIWIESQNTTSTDAKKSDTLTVETNGWGNKQFLSGESWLQIKADADKIAQSVPESGLTLSYDFSIEAAGPHQIWNRVGYEFVRSPFEWRVDGAEWKRAAPDDLTVDLMPLAEWTEVAWLRLGEANLKAGAHTLQIRLVREKEGDKGDKFKRLLYASDALVIAPDFAPNGGFRPGQDYRDANDQRAAANRFQLPAANEGRRAEIALKGLWQIARDDELLPARVDQPIAQLPANPNWYGIAVPGDKADNNPRFGLAHRVWYRCRVDVPASQVGRSFFLDFPLNNLNTTVYVNGQQCGFFPTPFARFQIDVTKAVKAGENEIMVGIRDAYYGFQADASDPMKLRRNWNFPLSKWNSGFMDLAYPVWNCPQSGLLNTPTLVAAGAAYASDVFVKPDVGSKKLDAQITLSNPSKTAINGEIRALALDVDGKVAHTFKSAPFAVGAGQTQTINWSDGWADATLWWPDAPKLYDLRLQLVSQGAVIDQSDTRFGFRQWTTDGIKYRLNGVVWHMWGELVQNGDKESWLADYKRKNQRTYRFVTAGQTGHDSHFWKGLETQAALDWMDAGGVTVRRNSTLDGEVIGYKFKEEDADIVRAQGGSVLKLDLMKHWREQCVAQVRGERNHPSIQIWSIENEFAYINLINLLGNSPQMDEYEREIIKTSDAVMAVDPTRSVMIDGGGATKFQALPTHGDHYVWSADDARYPDLAYQPYPTGGGRGRWTWDQTRPRWLGEDFYATGVNPADYAIWGGEVAFGGKAQARAAAGRVYRMLQEGYRWGGHYAAWQFWIGEETATGQYGANAPRLALCRQWDWTFGSGDKVGRTWGLFNDSHYADPLTFTRAILVDGKTAWRQQSTHTVAPGTALKWDETVPMPVVTKRTEAQMVLKVEVGGQEIYRDTKPLSILPPAFATRGEKTATNSALNAPRIGLNAPRVARNAPRVALNSSRVALNSSRVALNASRVGLNASRVGLDASHQTRDLSRLRPETRALAQVKPTDSGLAVYDPKNAVAPFLTANKVAFARLNSLESLPSTKTLLIGPDALSEAEATSSRLAAWAAQGRSLIVLEQENPLHFQAIPAQMTLADVTPDGGAAFIEDSSSPALRGLRDQDFFGWPGGVYRDAYFKPTRGARSLVQAGARLGNSVLAEVPTGQGVMLLSQIKIGAALPTNATAQTLLANLLDYGRAYRQEFRAVSVASDDARLLQALDATGVKYERGDLIQALTGDRIVVASANRANLQKLVQNRAKVEAFHQGGGYLMLHGLARDRLGEWNQLVGYDHLIRPFGRERVGFAAKRDPLTVGMTLGDLVMLSGERIFGWTKDEFVSSDVYSNVVDYKDVAPFAKSDFFAYPNIVNGFTNADGWKLIINFEIPKTEAGEFKPYSLQMELPQPQTLGAWTWTGNTNYYPQNEVKLTFNGQTTKTLTFPVAPDGEAQTFEFEPVKDVKTVELTISGWQVKPGSKPLIGIDNISLWAQRPPGFEERVKPLDSVGGLMHYPRGRGGIVLNQLKFQDSESVPVNALKKRAILAAILRNLKAPFAGGDMVLAGQNLDYLPIEIGPSANLFRGERGWFGDANKTFADLPTGKNSFAGVPFSVYDFPTSPVPTAVSLQGAKGVEATSVKEIAVGTKARALFFLQTAKIDKRRSKDDIKKDRIFEVAHYAVNYADGSRERVPIRAELDVENWKQKAPKALPGAQVAWTKTLGEGEVAVAYLQTWNNPKPDIQIKSIDLEYGEQRAGVPVLLALTAAR